MLFIKAKGIYNTYKGRLRKEIQKYCQENTITENEFRFLSIHQWQNVYDKIVSTFGKHEYVSVNGLHWLNTNCAYKKELLYSFASDEKWDWILKLPDIVKKEDLIYLVLEETAQKNKFWIAEGTPTRIAELLYEGFFDDDYYIVDKKFQWMITRDHHSIVHFVGKLCLDLLYKNGVYEIN